MSDAPRTSHAAPRTPGAVLPSAMRIFDLSLGQMLWSRRSVFLGVLLGGPVLLAVILRIVDTLHASGFRVNGAAVGGSAIFGMMIWLLFIRFIVPVLGVFYGTSLIADEVEDKTITYLFTRPIPRRAVLLGKYLAYLACTVLLVLPSVMLVFFLIVPTGGGSIGAAFPVAARRPRDAGGRPGRLRRGVRAGRHPAQAAAGGRAGLCVRLGAGGAAVSGLPQAADRRLLPAGAGHARNAPGLGR